MHDVLERLPSLRGVEAFVSAAELLSFRSAAERLHVTTSAVSRRVQALEDQIGTPLFDRGARTVRLTAAGRDYLEMLLPGLNIMRQAAREMRSGRRGINVRIATTSMISGQWLNRLLPSFMAEWPGAEIEVYTIESLKTSIDLEIDLCICTQADGTDTGDAVRLFGMDFFPIANPDLVRAMDICEPADLGRVTLIDTSAARDAWSMWLRSAGVRDFVAGASLMIEDPLAYLDAVAQGLGVGLGSMTLTGERLRSGRVVKLFDTVCSYPRGAYLKCADGVPKKPIARAFRDWIIAQAQADAL